MRFVLVLGLLSLSASIAGTAHARPGIAARIQKQVGRMGVAVRRSWRTRAQLRHFLRERGSWQLPDEEGTGHRRLAERKRAIDKLHRMGRRRFFAYASTAGTALGTVGAVAALASSSPMLALAAVASATFSGLRSYYFRHSLARHELLARAQLLAEFSQTFGINDVRNLARETERSLQKMVRLDRRKLRRAEADPLRWATRGHRRRRLERSETMLRELSAAMATSAAARRAP